MCVHLDGLNAEDQFVTILDDTFLFFFFLALSCDAILFIVFIYLNLCVCTNNMFGW